MIFNLILLVMSVCLIGYIILFPKETKLKGKIYCGLLALLLLGGVLKRPLYVYMTDNHQVITVSKTDIKWDKKKDKDLYLVYSPEGTFKVEDCGWRFQFKSSDIYGKFVPSKTYRVKYYGWRFGLLSMYPNIYDVSPIDPNRVAQK